MPITDKHDQMDHLRRLRRRGATMLWVEFAVQATLPAICIILGYLSFAILIFGNPWLFGVAILLAATVGLWAASRQSRPTMETIHQRIEQASRLRHRPFAMLDDHPESEEAIARILWRAHQQRITSDLKKARVGFAKFQPVAGRLRILAILSATLWVICLTDGQSAATRFAAAVGLPSWMVRAPAINAWLTPPDFTDMAPVTLKSGHNAAPHWVTALGGSKITLILSGTDSAPPAWLNAHRLVFTRLTADSFRATIGINTTASLQIGPWWRILADWRIAIEPPAAPIIAFRNPPRIIDGQLMLAWQVSDRYGLNNVEAQMTPLDNPRMLPQIFQLSTNLGAGIALRDLTGSPFAGGAVRLLLSARNRAGALGYSTAVTLQLPAAGAQSSSVRSAAAVIEQSLDPNAPATGFDQAQLNDFLQHVKDGLRKGTGGNGSICRTGSNIEASVNGNMMAQTADDGGHREDHSANAELAAIAASLDELMQAQASLLDATNHGTISVPLQTQLRHGLHMASEQIAKAGLTLPGLAQAASAMGAATNALQTNAPQQAVAAQMNAISGLQIASAALAGKRDEALSPAQGNTPMAGLRASDILINGMPASTRSSSTEAAQSAPAIVQNEIIRQESRSSEPAAARAYFHTLLTNQ